MVIGATVTGVFAALATTKVKSSFVVQLPHRTPADFQTSLAGGQWEIYELTGSVDRHSFGPFSYGAVRQSVPDIDPSSIDATTQLGQHLRLHGHFSAAHFENYRTGSDIYTGIATFKVPTSGIYSFSVISPGPDQVLIGRPVSTALTAPLPWLAVAAGGGLLFTTALILLIVEVDRTRRRKDNPPGGPPSTTPTWSLSHPPGLAWAPPPWPPPPPSQVNRAAES